MTTAEILNEISKLPPGEKRSIFKRLDDVLHHEKIVSTEELREREFEQMLLAEGIIREIPSDWNEDDDFEPINIIGKPLSETVIEDRGE